MPARRTFEQAKLLFTGEPGECWYLPEGFGFPTPEGYRRLPASGKNWLAHRLSYTLHVGDIPAGMTLDHLRHTWARDACAGGPDCPHRACMNPDHLEPVPSGVNGLRGNSPPALNARSERCKRGHSYSRNRRGRYCAVCDEQYRRVVGHISPRGRKVDRTHCIHGHPFDESNTLVITKPDGRTARQCRTCNRERTRRYSAAKRTGNR